MLQSSNLKMEAEGSTEPLVNSLRHILEECTKAKSRFTCHEIPSIL